MVSVGILSVAYVFAFLNTFRFTRTNRFLGPLRVSLAKMMFNVLQFLAIFALLMLAFTISLTELYWYAGTVEGKERFCQHKNNSTEEFCPRPNGVVSTNTCNGPIFTSALSTFIDLFWALFGEQLGIECLRKHRDDDFYIDYTAMFLMGLFYISIVFILFNMLIDMMSESFNSATQKKDALWKFYRTNVWIEFIRRDYGGPPPMNLLTDFFSICKKIKKSDWKICFCCDQQKKEKVRMKVSHELMNRLISSGGIQGVL